MRHRTTVVTGMAILAALTGVGANAGGRQAGVEPVVLSAVVVGRNGLPVGGLAANDFRITENGKPMIVRDVSAVSTGTAAARGRSVVVVLGSAGTDPALTTRVQKIARRFIEKAASHDQVSVIRVAHREDEIGGDRRDMLMRIAEYRAPTGEPYHRKTSHDVLDLVARLSRDLTDVEAPRRAIVFVGSPFIFDVVDPVEREGALVWPHWVSALTSAARAAVSVYVIDPHGLRGNIWINPDGLVAQTGGAVFQNMNDFDRAVDRVWRDTSSYYVLRYTPEATTRELQSISVKVARSGVTVRAHRSR